MAFRAVINGYGRIGRMVLRALLERKTCKRLDIEVVAINEPAADLEAVAYLTEYDSSHGRMDDKIGFDLNQQLLCINDKKIRVFHQYQPENLDFSDITPDIILECSGSFTDRKTAEVYLVHSPKLLFSNPAQPDVDATIVFGFNHSQLKPDHNIVSCASCTTNCIVPIVSLLDDAFGIHSGCITTLHSVMNDQPVIDAYHRKTLRLNRSALQSFIPVETSLSKGIDRLLPHLKGRFEATAVRAPVTNVSAMILTVNVEKECTINTVNTLIKNAASSSKFTNIIGYTEAPHVSVDFNHDSRSGVVDGTQTKVVSGRMIKIFCWFDNEWGFANRMLDVANYWLACEVDTEE